MFWRLVACSILALSFKTQKGKYLSNLPVDTGASSCGETCKIDHKIPHLAEEIILVSVPICYHSILDTQKNTWKMTYHQSYRMDQSQ